MFKAVALPTELTRHCLPVYSIVHDYRKHLLPVRAHHTLLLPGERFLDVLRGITSACSEGIAAGRTASPIAL